MLTYSLSQPLRSLLLAHMLAGLTLPSLAGVSSQPRILGRADVTVKGKIVYLGEVLRTESVEAGVSDQLNSAVLGPAPQAGKTRILAGVDVIHKLECFGITSRDYRIQMPEEIRVSRFSRILSGGDLQDIVVHEFLPTLPWKQVRLETLEIPETILLPEGESRLSFEYSRRTDLARPFFLAVSISIDEEVVRKLFLRTSLSIEETVAVTTRELTAGQLVGAEDVRWEKRRLGSTLHPPILDVSLLEGKKPRTSIPAGQILTDDLLIKAPLVKRGDTITLVCQNGKIRVKTQAKCLASGMRGDQIQVMNLDSKKILKAEILDQGTAQVSF